MMLIESFTLLFYLKRRANYQAGELPICMRVTIDGGRFEMATKRQCEPDRWNARYLSFFPLLPLLACPVPE
jgi:hypothetical protein